MTTPRAVLADVLLRTFGPRYDTTARPLGWPMEDADAILAALASQGYAVTRSEAGLDVDVAALRRFHYERPRPPFRGKVSHVTQCASDQKPWPCDVARLLARLAAVTRSEAGLDVERLGDAVAWWLGVIGLAAHVDDVDVALLAAEYARLAADPEPSDV